jgi:hypothetical protein
MKAQKSALPAKVAKPVAVILKMIALALAKRAKRGQQPNRAKIRQRVGAIATAANASHLFIELNETAGIIVALY